MSETIQIKYLPGAPHLEQVEGSDWIDCYLYEDIIAKQGDYGITSLGFAAKLPAGYECNIVPRSSTFKRYGILQTNSFAVIDETYCGDTDIYCYPWYATRDITIPAGTRVCQMRLNKKQPTIEFEEVETLNSKARSGFGSSGI